MSLSFDFELSRREASMNSDESSVCSNDSIWDSDAESDCESLCSFDVAGEDGHELEEENGRRYNAFPSDAYQFPVDQKEQDRSDIVHSALLRLFDGELYTSPVQEPERILDVMSGSGAWAAEMAYKHTESLVYGMDLVPVQAESPSNCLFEVENVESLWCHPTNYFDLIHGRFMYGGITSWECFFQQAFRHLRPGGFLELQDMPFELFSQGRPASHNLSAVKFMKDLTRALGMAQKTLPYQRFESMLRAAGFIDVEVEERELPIGSWVSHSGGKEIGRLNLLNMLQGSEAWAMRPFTQSLGRTHSEVKQLAQAAAADFQNRRNKLYTKLLIFRARKAPLTTPSS